MEINLTTKIYVAGHRGLVGAALVRALQSQGYENLISRTRSELDLCRQGAVEDFFAKERPQVVLLAAAKVGGILANDSYPVDFLRDNLLIETNIIESAYRYGCQKLVFLGSSCIYPKLAPQPMQESHLLTGPLEPTNEWYAVAKIAGIKLCQAYRKQHGFDAISLMPTNLYGPGDNFDLQTSHVLPALIRKFHEAKVNQSPQVSVWGSGKPRREFLHVDDLADACLYLMQHYADQEIINIGWGEDVSIQQLAQQVADTVGYKGEVVFDTSKPDGTPRKLLDTSRLTQLGWQPKITLKKGLLDTYRWFTEHHG